MTKRTISESYIGRNEHFHAERVMVRRHANCDHRGGWRVRLDADTAPFEVATCPKCGYERWAVCS